MKRFSIYISLIFFIFIGFQTHAQSLIVGYDTVCINYELQLTTTDTLSNTNYWGFCSGYINNTPAGSSIAAGTGLNAPTSIATQKANNLYYVFAVNSGGNRDIIRYDFNVNLPSVPTANNIGNLGAMVPVNPTGMQIVKDFAGNWHGFLLGGTLGKYNLVRMDFGNSLSNIPTSEDLGSLGGVLNQPQDLYVFNEGGNWYAMVFGALGHVHLVNFGVNIENSAPTTSLLDNIGAGVSGIWPVLENGNWYIFYVNKTDHSLNRIDFGNSLANGFLPLTKFQIAGGTLGLPFNDPKDVSFIKDCGMYYAFVTNQGDNSMTKLTFNSSVKNVPAILNLGNFAGLNGPSYLTHYLRDKDNIISFTANKNDNSISRLEYNSCIASTIPSSTLKTPPSYSYTTPGTYNVYYVGDEGLPTMKVDCKLITVLPKPLVQISNDTVICQGDTLRLIANGINAFSVNWDPVYNAQLPTDVTTIYVHPHEDYRYNAHLEFLSHDGCPYDTSVFVKVNRVVADAGADISVADGAYTVLGGPKTSYGSEFKYKWRPPLYLDDTLSANPTCTPLDVQAYYFEVYSDSSRCVATDTVWVRTECSDFNLPNVFNPSSDIPVNRNFGLLNYNVIKLEHFKIFNRWGGLVFETKDPKKRWDGTFNNLELPSDNYVWILDGYCVNGKRIRKQGTVLLVK